MECLLVSLLLVLIKSQRQLQVTQNGEIRHDVTIETKFWEAITGLSGMGVSLDTMLDGDDRIPIYSDGDGGIYIQNDGITLYCSPVANNVFAGEWNTTDRSAYVTANGAEGTILKMVLTRISCMKPL